MFVEQNVTGTKYGHAWGFYCSQWGVLAELAEVGRQKVMHTGKQTLFLHLSPLGKGQIQQGSNAGSNQQANGNK